MIQTNSGKRAKRLIHSHKGPIALAVCDIQMPAGNGLDFAVALEALRPGVPVLFISGLIDSVAVQGILLRKPCSILTKPFSGEALVDRVRLLAGATLTTPLLERPASHTGSEGKAQK